MSPPVVADGTVYVGSYDSNVYALSATDGNEQWRYQTDGEIWSAPAVIDDTVYVGSEDSYLYALSRDTGNKCWRFETDGDVNCAPTVSNGVVYIGMNDVSGMSMYAIRASDGEELWSADSFGTGTTVAVADGMAFIGTGASDLRAFDAETGDQIWRFGVDDYVFSPPTVGGGRVYFGSQDQSLYAVNKSNGELEWQFSTDDAISTSPAFANQAVYVGSGDGNLYALNASDGTEKWRFGGGRTISNPVVANDIVYVSGVYRLFALDTNNVERLWSFDVSSQAPAIVENRMYVANTEGVYALTGRTDDDAAPQPQFAITPNNPTTGTEVEFNAANSSDPDGTIQTYEWDLDDDSTYEKTGQTVTHTFSSSGGQTVTLRVTDSDGAAATTTQTVTVSHGSSSLPPNLQRFDTNGQPGIQRGEVVDAIVAYNTDANLGGRPVSRSDVVDVIVKFNS
jgi:outer membrane protein assembly factor BamB